MNGLDLNIQTNEEDLIDKITNLEAKKQALSRYIEVSKEGPSTISYKGRKDLKQKL